MLRCHSLSVRKCDSGVETAVSLYLPPSLLSLSQLRVFTHSICQSAADILATKVPFPSLVQKNGRRHLRRRRSA